MARKVKALRALALLTALGGASILALSAGSSSAKASEERLHNETLTTFGLLPPGPVGTVSTEGGDNVTSSSMSIASGIKAPAMKDHKAPDLEDPGLPGYDGPGDQPASARSAAR